jgi:hypothetical protein
VTTGKAITLGVGVGVIAYLALSVGSSLSGVTIGELDQFPTSVECLAEREGLKSETQEECRKFRSYFRGEPGNPTRVERLAAEILAAANGFTATVRADVDEIVDVWVDPILSRLKMAADVVKDIFAP